MHMVFSSLGRCFEASYVWAHISVDILSFRKVSSTLIMHLWSLLKRIIGPS